MTESTNVSHTNAAHALDEISNHAWQTIVKMEASEQTEPNRIFDPPETQRQAHAYVIGYHKQIAQKTYTVHAKDYWEDEFTTEDGETYYVRVPKNQVIDLDEHDSLQADTIERDEEPITLENISNRWSMREVKTVYTQSDSYGTGERVQKMKKLWLPPRAISLAYEQLEDVRAKIGLKAEIDTPGWHSEDPI